MKFFIGALLILSTAYAQKTNPDREKLAKELKAKCLENFEFEQPEDAEKWCACILRHHSQYTSDENLKILIEIYGGSRKYENPGISSAVSILLNNDADLIEKCEGNPNWDSK